MAYMGSMTTKPEMRCRAVVSQLNWQSHISRTSSSRSGPSKQSEAVERIRDGEENQMDRTMTDRVENHW